MLSKYLIKIYTRDFQTKFNLQTESSMITMKQVHKEIIDYIGKNDIEWEPNNLHYNGKSKFYITYEEVNDGPRQDGVVRQEAEARV